MVIFDFMMAIVLFIVLSGLALGLYVVAADSSSADSRAADLAADRAGARLVGDLLVEEAGDEALAIGCTDAFFSAETATADAQRCGFTRFNGSSEEAYLRSALGLGSEYAVNLTLGGPSSTRSRLGPAPPPTGDIAHQTRLVTFDGSTGSREFYVIHITVWEVSGA